MKRSVGRTTSARIWLRLSASRMATALLEWILFQDRVIACGKKEGGGSIRLGRWVYKI